MAQAAKKRDPRECDRLAAEYLKDQISPETQKLINLATFDLYYGPVGDGAIGDPAVDVDGNENEWAGYPGFVKACDAIAAAVQELPKTLYVDLDCDEVTENEPEDERCEDCDGQGEYCADDNNDPCGGSNRYRCDACHGRGYFDPSGDWYKLESGEIRKAIVGRELAEYL